MLRHAAARLYSTATTSSAAPPAAVVEQFVQVKVPYFVHRTKLAQQLPVYPRYTFKGTQVCTIIRRIEGDGKALAYEMQEAFPRMTVSYNRNSNTIELKGNQVPLVRQYLTERGF
ncbi:mitochondrial large subunit ribosomal protein-domain-containing protein [Blastocladiella britannica]|nr:mitochondrial large subunit ribosomal protein-domain-containing protein [Blastocladiella britannica]